MSDQALVRREFEVGATRVRIYRDLPEPTAEERAIFDEPTRQDSRATTQQPAQLDEERRSAKGDGKGGKTPKKGEGDAEA